MPITIPHCTEMILEMNGFEVDTYNDPLLALSNFKPNSLHRELLLESYE
jgi:hypothetical protein